MKIALLSDIHANRQALDACLQHARAQGAEQQPKIDYVASHARLLSCLGAEQRWTPPPSRLVRRAI